MAQATFYAVQGPRGMYYAVRNHETRQVWTERTELAAHQQAEDEKLIIVAEETIDHAGLLDLMIPQNSVTHPITQPGPKIPAYPTLSIKSGLSRFFSRLRHPSQPDAPTKVSARDSV